MAGRAVAIDFETANERRDSACSLGIAVIENLKIVETRSWLIRPPELRFNPINVGIHGISAEDVVREPSFTELFSQIHDYFTQHTLVAHNAAFDMSVLKALLRQLSVEYIAVDYTCSCIMSRRVWPDLPNHKLPTVAEHLGIDLVHHCAEDDARASALIAIECCRQVGAKNIPDAVVKLQMKPKVLFGVGSGTEADPGIEVSTITLGRTDHRSTEDATMDGMGQLLVSYTSTGLARYEVKITNEELNRVQVVKGDDPDIVVEKATAKLLQWEEMADRKEEARQKELDRRARIAMHEDGKRVAAERTEAAAQEMQGLESILLHTLSIDDTVDWNQLKGSPTYSVPIPKAPRAPKKPIKPDIPDKPLPTSPAYNPSLDILDKALKGRREKKIKAASQRYSADIAAWESRRQRLIEEYNAAVRDYNETVKQRKRDFQQRTLAWEQAKADHASAYLRRSKAVDQRKQKYLDGAPDAIIDYCEMVLNNSVYADYFPKTFNLEFKPENGILIVDYDLSKPEDLPTLIEVKYVQSRQELKEKHLTEKQRNSLYDKVLYQLALRTIHELFEADAIDAIESIVFNGFVTAIDRAVGKETYGCVLSLQAAKDEFEEIDLAHVDPKTCFRSLKGVGSSKLHSITPVAPIISIDREDKRFTEAYQVADTIEEGDNLASMPWEDFEHLVREIFEKHFADGGGEVRVTRASRDGGVDAVVFDPDPIRGGKIVIQAKRYTNVVGVSAVRDLYGTVVNEGANKGILVTTSNYGPDAYGFAKGKPLTLLDGGHLLHLLASHGHKARIDLKEAKLEQGGAA